MSMSKEVTTHLEKIYELVYQQVNGEHESLAPLSESASVAKIQQENRALLLQLEELKSQQSLDQEHYHRQLSAREKQIQQLQFQYDEADQNNQSQRAHIKVLEQEKQSALGKIADLDLSQTGSIDYDNQEIELLKQELEDAKIHCKVLKHHYSKLVDKNEEMKATLAKAETNVLQLENNFQQKSDQLHLLQKNYKEMEQVNNEQKSEIARQKADLMHAMDNYYDGVINNDKKVSTNVPRAN